MKATIVLASVLVASTLLAADESTYVSTIEPAQANRGERVMLTVAHVHQALVHPQVMLQGPSEAEKSQEYVSTAFPAGTSGANMLYQFVLRDDLSFGTYDVYFRYDGVAPPGLLAAPAQRFRVTPKAPPRLTAAYPSVGYQSDGRYNVTVVGDGFARNAADHALVLNGRYIPACPDSKPALTCANATFATPGRVLRFINIPPAPDKETLRGEQKVGVAIDGQVSQEAFNVTFAAAQRGTPGRAAALVTLFIALLVILPALAAPRQLTWAGNAWKGRAQSALRSIFLDTQTNTYSLSKAQFYAWTLAAVYGYVYLTAARSLIQGKFELSPIPEGLPGILLVSIGTSTIATGLGNSRTKGAGSSTPRLSDFFTTGGVVVPERVQFFVWTLLGVGAWIALVAASDPGTIATLPKVPEGFLALMGISSAGYLGGKFARQPGPIISNASARFSTFTVEIHGRYLATNAVIMLNEERIEPDWYVPLADGKRAPEVVAYDEDKRYAKQLRLVLTGVTDDGKGARLPNNAAIPDASLLTIVNPDGQKAEFDVTITRLPTESP